MFQSLDHKHTTIKIIELERGEWVETAMLRLPKRMQRFSVTCSEQVNNINYIIYYLLEKGTTYN